MAEIQPLRALHYDQAVVGSLADVTAPPYDVIDSTQRAELLARSPCNIVAIDLPEGEPDRYAAAASLLETWRLQGALVRDSEPAIWAHAQEYAGPDGRRLTRRGFFCRVRIEEYGPGRVRPHERTHPGPEGGPLTSHARDAREHFPDLLALLRPHAGGMGGARAGHRGHALGRGHRCAGHDASPLASLRLAGDRRGAAGHP